MIRCSSRRTPEAARGRHRNRKGGNRDTTATRPDTWQGQGDERVTRGRIATCCDLEWRSAAPRTTRISRAKSSRGQATDATTTGSALFNAKEVHCFEQQFGERTQEGVSSQFHLWRLSGTWQMSTDCFAHCDMRRVRQAQHIGIVAPQYNRQICV